jgi:hypothetical protein
MVAGSLMAQDTSEFNRTSGGQIEVLSRHARNFSGSLGMRMMGSSAAKGYEATLGGTVIEDRLWFFAAAQKQQGSWFASALPQMARPFDAGGASGKLSAQIGDRNSLIGSFGAARETSPVMLDRSIPSSFLSLRYTGTVSSSMFFSASFFSASFSGRSVALRDR